MAKPTDVSDWVEVVPQYETTDIPNTSIDGSVTPHNHALTDLPDNFPSDTTGKIVTGDMSSSFVLTTADGGSGTEAKFRTHVNTTKILYDDPIRNFGQPGASHGHQFFGNVFVNAYSTYDSLRENSKSFAAGADLNATAYWFPFPVKDGRAVRSHLVTVYYTLNPVDGKKATRIPHGLRYVTGFEMDDEWAWLQAHLDTANAAAGFTRYELVDPNGNYHGKPKWYCSGSSGPQDWLKNADGTDPFGGTCAAGSQFYVELHASPCWDMTNLWSPTGYHHVIPRVWDNRDSKWVCPKNFGVLPELIIKAEFEQEGFADFGQWRLTSDDMAQTMRGSTVNNGESFHTDWFDAWDQTIKVTWNQNCIGVEGGTPHQCDSSVISATQQLLLTGSAPDGRSPQVECVGAGCTKYPTSDPTNSFGTSRVHTGRPDVLHIGAEAVAVHLFIEGDSISMCNGAGGGAVCSGSSTYTQKYAASNGAVQTYGYAIGGDQLADMEARVATLLAAKPTTDLWVASLLAGANDLGGQDTTAYLARLQAWVTSMRDAGAKVVLGTILPNAAGGDGGVAFNADRAVVNAGIRQMFADGEIDALADYAADPIMGPDDSFTVNPTYWSDATHPSGLGTDIMEGIFQSAMDLATA